MSRRFLAAVALAAALLVGASTVSAVGTAGAAPAAPAAPAEGATAWRITDLGTGRTARDLSSNGIVVGDAWGSTSGGFFRWKDGQLRIIGQQGVGANRANAVNRSGVMAVWTQFDESIRYDAGKVRNLGSLTPSGGETFAADITDAGLIVGSSQAVDEFHAFSWEHGKMTDLGTAGGVRSFVDAVNEHGQIVGTSVRANGTTHLIVWDHGRVTDLGRLPGDGFPADINDAGQIVGSLTNASGAGRAFVWTNGTIQRLPPLPGGTSSFASAINNKGDVVGVSDLANGDRHAVVWTGGTVRDLGTLGGAFSDTVGINDAGMVAGNAQDARGNEHAVVWNR
jgi:probable HAF family extracellular repeat protein